MTITTDAEWKQEFARIRDNTEKAQNGAMPVAGIASEYYRFVNDTLVSLRHGHTSWAYYAYQIEELLKYEKDRLRTRYVPADKYWILWLEKKGTKKCGKTRKTS